MSKRLIIALVIGLCALPVMAQENMPKAEIFGGYQYTRMGVSGSGFNLNGWNGSVTGNLNNWLGVTADFSGAYKSVSASAGGISASADFKSYTYTFGPVVSANRGGAFTPFAHALFGGVRASVSGSGTGLGTLSASDSGFAMMLGGGADARLTKHIAVRLVQADWLRYSISGESGNSNARISTGLVFRF
jgi:hypothetical protein